MTHSFNFCNYHYQILKSDIDKYDDGRIPHCQLSLTHTGGPLPGYFVYDLSLTGANEQSIRMSIDCSEVIYALVFTLHGSIVNANITTESLKHVLYLTIYIYL